MKGIDWIPPELEEDAKVSLRLEMERPLSQFDRSSSGFVYCFEYRGKVPFFFSLLKRKRTLRRALDLGLSTATHRVFKIGRSVNPVSRMEEWARQCPSHQAILLGCRPEVGQDGEGGRMKGMRMFGGEHRGVKGSAKLESLSFCFLYVPVKDAHTIIHA